MSELIAEIQKTVEALKANLLKSTMKPEHIQRIINDVKEALAVLPERAETANEETQKNIRKLILGITKDLEELRMTMVGKMSWDPRYGAPLRKGS